RGRDRRSDRHRSRGGHMNLAMLLDIPSMIVPDDAAIMTEKGTTTYGELRANAAAVAGHLASLGVGPGDRVGLFATNSAEYVAALFGIASRGAVTVPMNVRARGEEV